MMDLSAVDLNLLVSLRLLLEERSVRGAARRAHISPSAMSHTLQRLRTLLGDEILVRAGRELVLTPRARELADPVGALLDQARAVLAPPAVLAPETLQRAYRLVCTDHVAAVLLPAVEERLQAEAPGVDLYVRPLVPETMADMRAGQVEAAIGIFPEAPPELRMRRLFSDRFVTVARADHPRLGPQAHLSREAFLAEQHLLVAPRGEPTGLIDRLLAREGQQRRIARTLPHFLSALWHLAESDRLLTISARLVAATRSRIPLRVFETPLPVEDYTLMLVWHPRLDRATEEVWFRDLLLRAAETLPPL